MMGLYKITNLENNRFYGGSSVDINDRWREHIRCAKTGSKYPVHEAIRKYGKSKFKFEILQVCTIEELEDLEQKWLDENIHNPLCYNISECVYAPMRGKRHTEETKKKISLTKLLNPLSEESKKRISRSGSKWSSIQRKKFLVWATGRNHSEQARSNMSRAALRRYDADGLEYPSLININTGEIIPSGVNIRRLCKNRNLPLNSIFNLIRGKTKTSRYAWRIL